MRITELTAENLNLLVERVVKASLSDKTAEGKSSAVFLFGKLLKHIFYSDTLYSSLQKIAEKERKYKAN